MAAFDHTDETAFRSVHTGRKPGMAAAMERFGRELVWLLIAVAFCVIEAAVFLTDLPVAKFFQRNSRKP